jgi:hypothetical protein
MVVQNACQSGACLCRMRAQTLDSHDVRAGQESSPTGLENRYGLSLSRASKAAAPFNSGTTLLTKAFADLTATTGTRVC